MKTHLCKCIDNEHNQILIVGQYYICSEYYGANHYKVLTIGKRLYKHRFEIIYTFSNTNMVELIYEYSK